MSRKSACPDTGVFAFAGDAHYRMLATMRSARFPGCEQARVTQRVGQGAVCLMRCACRSLARLSLRPLACSALDAR